MQERPRHFAPDELVQQRDPVDALQRRVWEAGYAQAAAYFPGLPRRDFYAFASDYSLAMSEWDDMVGDEPAQEAVDRFYREGYGLLFNLLRHVRPEGEWTADADRGNLIRPVMHAAGLTSILDFGGGIGSMAMALARWGFQVGYVDVGETEWFGKWRLEHAGLRVPRGEAQPGKVVNGFPDPCQAIAALDVLEHLWEPEDLLHTFHAALPPNGLLFLTRHSFKEHPTHLERTFYLYEKLDEVLARIGFVPHSQPDGHYGIGAWRRL